MFWYFGFCPFLTLLHYWMFDKPTKAVNGYPDTQLVSYGEMYSAASTVSEGLASVGLELGVEPIPCIADGDTGEITVQ